MIPSYDLVDDEEGVVRMMDSFPDFDTSDQEHHGGHPRLYMDLEGNNLGRKGSLSLLTLLVYPQKQRYMLDVTTLGASAFDTCGTEIKDRNLRSILESKIIPKALFDVRNDSDAMFSLYGVRLQNIHDIQLMELASRNNYPGYGKVKSLELCMELCLETDKNGQPDHDTLWEISEAKRAGVWLKEHNAWHMFDQRPLMSTDSDPKYTLKDTEYVPNLKKYVEVDVEYLPLLWIEHRRKLSDEWWTKVLAESTVRVEESQTVDYNPSPGETEIYAKVIGPTEWQVLPAGHVEPEREPEF